MEVWSRLFDVPQRGDLEDHLVDLVLSYLVASLVGLDGPRLHNAELLVHRSTDIRTVVAPLAAGCGKCVEARFFSVRQSRLVALEEGIPARRSHQSTLEGSNRQRHVVVSNRILVLRKSCLEKRNVLR